MEEPENESAGSPPPEAGGVKEPPTRIVVGLGNPGPRYRDTRHNVGFRAVDLLAERLRVEREEPLSHSVAARIQVGEARVWLAKPLTFMNRSGRAVRELLEVSGDVDAGILIIYDDFHLPLGRIRFRPKGSAGGQNGVKSIIETLGREDFGRLRIGIGSPRAGEDPADHVLSPVPPGERRVLEETIELAAEGAESWIRSGDLVDCMNRYNGGA